MTQSEKQNVLAVSLFAGLVGAGVGMLVAPRSGRETRENIRSAARDAKHRAKEGFDEARGQVGQKLDQARDTKAKFSGAMRSLGKKKKSDSPEDSSFDSPIITAWNEEV